MPNVMAAQPNICGALADYTYVDDVAYCYRRSSVVCRSFMIVHEPIKNR